MRALALAGLALLGFSSSTHASEMPKNWLFLGVNFGYLGVNPSPPLEVNKSGLESGVKLVASHDFDAPWLVDLGGGWLYSYVTGEGLGAIKNVKTVTRSFFAEISPRYRFGSHWQLGPVLQFLTGGDVSYDEDGTVDEQKSLWRLGGRIQYQVGNDWRWRFGVQAFTDLNISSRNILGVVADIQFGFGVGARQTSAPADEAISTRLKPEVVEIQGNNVRLYLDENLLRFQTGKSKLDSRSQATLKKIVPVLAKNQSAWKKLRIEGHTDVRNHSGMNQALSEERARTVESLLTRSNLPKEKITTVGLAATRPIDPARNAHAYATNRRVEIWLEDVDPGLIQSIRSELQQTQAPLPQNTSNR